MVDVDIPPITESFTRAQRPAFSALSKVIVDKDAEEAVWLGAACKSVEISFIVATVMPMHINEIRDVFTFTPLR
jgi:hypothetical protein